MISRIAKLAGAAMAIGFFSGSAMANVYPASVVGTWHAVANQSDFTLTISSQESSGSCRAISGTIVGNGELSDVVGFYCPGTGRFNFVRNYPPTGQTVQDYSGNVSETGNTLYMGGVFSQVVSETTPSDIGDASFFASK